MELWFYDLHLRAIGHGIRVPSASLASIRRPLLKR